MTTGMSAVSCCWRVLTVTSSDPTKRRITRPRTSSLGHLWRLFPAQLWSRGQFLHFNHSLCQNMWKRVVTSLFVTSGVSARSINYHEVTCVPQGESSRATSETAPTLLYLPELHPKDDENLEHEPDFFATLDGQRSILSALCGCSSCTWR